MASPILWSDVTSYPGLGKLVSVSAQAQTLILADVNSLVGLPPSLDGEAGPRTKLARILLAGHMGVSLPTFGPISSESAGGLSKSFAIPASTAEALMMTSFGRQYLGMISRSLAMMPIVG